MSDFTEFLHEQLKDPEMRAMWKAGNEAILQRTAGCMALSEMDLTEADKERILYLVEHPDEYNELLDAVIAKHRQVAE